MGNMKMGEAIRRIRKEKKKTLDEVAEAVGITHSYLSRIERNLQQPSIQVIEKIADYLGVHKSYLFFDEESLKNIQNRRNSYLHRKASQ